MPQSSLCHMGSDIEFRGYLWLHPACSSTNHAELKVNDPVVLNAVCVIMISNVSAVSRSMRSYDAELSEDKIFALSHALLAI